MLRCLRLQNNALALTQGNIDDPMQRRQEHDDELEHMQAVHLVATVVDWGDHVLRVLDIDKSRECAERNKLEDCECLTPGFNNSIHDKRLDKRLPGGFVAASFSMVPKSATTADNKEEGWDPEPSMMA